MRLALIYNTWHDFDLLECSLKIMRPLVDQVIIVASTRSSYGEHSPIPLEWQTDELFIREPQYPYPMHSETDKRNFGLQKARELGCTHFLSIDADEVYDPEEFKKAKQKFNTNPELKGMVCPCVVYFKSPTLTIGKDITLVPFIHVLSKSIRHDFNKSYPFAWSKGQIHIDPTRSMSINSGVEYTEEVTMHHFSWVRKDFELKIRNSTARANIERSTLRYDLMIAKAGEMCNYYGKRLTTVPNRFNFPLYGGELLQQDLLTGRKPLQAGNTTEQS